MYIWENLFMVTNLGSKSNMLIDHLNKKWYIYKILYCQSVVVFYFTMDFHYIVLLKTIKKNIMQDFIYTLPFLECHITES